MKLKLGSGTLRKVWQAQAGLGILMVKIRLEIGAFLPLKLQIRVILVGHTVAMVSYCLMKMITCSPMVRFVVF